jgi:hypothetical protein
VISSCPQARRGVHVADHAFTARARAGSYNVATPPQAAAVASQEEKIGGRQSRPSRAAAHAFSILKRQINGAQLARLNSLERFGWDIKFIRHDPAGKPLVVLHDPDPHKYAVLDTEGELDENPVWHSFRP